MCSDQIDLHGIVVLHVLLTCERGVDGLGNAWS